MDWKIELSQSFSCVAGLLTSSLCKIVEVISGSFQVVLAVTNEKDVSVV